MIHLASKVTPACPSHCLTPLRAVLSLVASETPCLYLNSICDTQLACQMTLSQGKKKFTEAKSIPECV